MEKKIQEWCSGASLKDTISFDFFLSWISSKNAVFYVVTVLLWSIHYWNRFSFKMLLHDGQCYLSGVSFRIGVLIVYQHFSWYSLMWSVTICMFSPPPPPAITIIWRLQVWSGSIRRIRRLGLNFCLRCFESITFLICFPPLPS